MATVLAANVTLTGNGTYSQDDTVSNQADTLRLDTAAMPSGAFVFTNGSAAGQATKWYREKRTLAAGATDSLNLTTLAKLPLNAGALGFTGIKYIYIAIYSPDGTKYLKFGPNGGGTPFLGPIKGSTSAYLEVHYMMHFPNPSAAGWPVGSGASDILYVNNPGANPVDYAIWLIGI